MSSKKVIYLLTALIIMINIIMVATTVFADIDISAVQGTTSDLATKTTSVGNLILGVLQAVAAVVAVIILVVLGVKYITAAPNDKAEIKKSITGYLIGAFIMFGASALLGIIKTFTNTALQ